MSKNFYNITNERKKNQANNKRLLIKGKMKTVSPFEKAVLFFKGKVDRKNKMLHIENGEVWATPFMARENERYEEYCSKLWGLNQYSYDCEYASTETLLMKIEAQKKELKDLEKYFQEEKEAYASNKTMRKHGEQSLNDNQIQSRRQNEWNKIAHPIKVEIEKKTKQINENYEEAIKSINLLIESANLTEYVCERVKHHTQQRIKIYLDSLLKKYNKENGQPESHYIIDSSEAHDIYLRQHRSLITIKEKCQEAYSYWIVETEKNMEE